MMNEWRNIMKKLSERETKLRLDIELNAERKMKKRSKRETKLKLDRELNTWTRKEHELKLYWKLTVY